MASGPQPQPQPNVPRTGLESVPLFMQSLPGDDTEDAALSALQNLAYEGTPDEIAENFKEQGNDYYKGKRFREARDFYTQGVDAHPESRIILEALLGNRAACNLELQNYGSVLKDCSKILAANPTSSKALYRSATALLKLGRLEEALDCCDRCLRHDPENKSVQSVRDTVTKLIREKEKKEREKEERLKKEMEEKRRLRVAFNERNILVVPNPDGSSQNPYAPHFDKDDPSTLVLPVFFLYPQYATSDIIAEFSEDTTFADHLDTMFPPQVPPPEWDKEREYVNGKMVIYAMTRRKRLLKVGKKMSLRDVCNAAKGKNEGEKDGLDLKEGCLTFVVLPKGDVEQRWVDDFKKSRDS